MTNEKRLIDANAVLLKLKQHHDLFIDAWEGFSSLPEKDKARVGEISNCIAEIFNATTVDAVEVVHGRWVTDGLGDGERVCSACKRYALYTHRDRYDQYLTAYCPNCGAKMDGDGNV